LVPDDATLNPIAGTLSWANGQATLALSDTSQWSGKEGYTAIGKVDGQDIAIPVLLQKSTKNVLTINTATSVTEGTGIDKTVNIAFTLTQPASEDMAMPWSVKGLGQYGVDASDFAGGVMPSGIATFARGDTTKLIQFRVAGDSTLEHDETMQIQVQVPSLAFTQVSLGAGTSTITVIDNDLSSYSGSAKYWKNDKPLTLNSGWMIEASNNLTPNADIEVRSVNYDASSNTIKGEIWINNSSAVSNIDLHFAKPTAANFSVVAGSGIASWTLLQNNHGEFFDLAAIGGSATNGPVKLIEFSISNISIGQEIQLTRGVVGDLELSSQKLFTTKSMTIKNGVIDTLANEGDYALTDGTSPSTAGALYSVDSRDALLALKMANGSIGTSAVENRLQFVAADVNKSGQVTALDAWLILRDLVGMDSGQVGEWQLVNQKSPTTSLNAQHAWDPQLIDITLNQTGTVDLIGVIRGDVDGSWGV
jgi:hypothetical protein